MLTFYDKDPKPADSSVRKDEPIQNEIQAVSP